MASISVSYGKAVFPTHSITVSSFVVQAPFSRVLASKTLNRTSPPHYNPAGRLSIEGGMATEHLEAPEGTVLLVQVQKKHNGRAMADGAVFLCIREEGPLLSLVAEMPRYHGSLLGNHFSVFQGRGDILSVEEAVAVGLDIPTNFVRGFMDKEEVEECIAVTTVSPELAKAPKFEVVESSDGEMVVVQKDQRVRRMRVRKA